MVRINYTWNKLHRLERELHSQGSQVPTGILSWLMTNYDAAVVFNTTDDLELSFLDEQRAMEFVLRYG